MNMFYSNEFLRKSAIVATLFFFIRFTRTLIYRDLIFSCLINR